MKKLIIASTSTIHGSGYLEYLLPTLTTFFVDVKTVLFIPYARPGGISYNEYTKTAEKAFAKINIGVTGIHQFENPKEAIQKAEAIFTGGGNTFELVNKLYKNDIIYALKQALETGTPYLGTSAGSNICGVNMKNTNDMPIVYPPSFTTLGIIPFNINAHFLDPIKGSKHMGETRETRIKEFHVFNEVAVLGLREGSWLEVFGDNISLKGKHTARLFQQNLEAIELEKGSLKWEAGK
ncbi:dipeptidase E [Polaribacter sp. Hel1_33_78]|jgi:dipeptidase E|uniref:dipeptidase PepE n=1 Tax=Polaribacter sp. Hel1_33_78 TaxID=1336804 RepID=UPI00087C0433|nr:dipeptidase PepE [Polaribacter sp. Hel1_33_78]SDU02164.1 dipeptidase E [Polaribacter sp. Hel1_33_78]